MSRCSSVCLTRRIGRFYRGRYWRKVDVPGPRRTNDAHSPDIRRRQVLALSSESALRRVWTMRAYARHIHLLLRCAFAAHCPRADCDIVHELAIRAPPPGPERVALRGTVSGGGADAEPGCAASTCVALAAAVSLQAATAAAPPHAPRLTHGDAFPTSCSYFRPSRSFYILAQSLV